MLSSLQIKDYALIENITVEFGKGLNIITGETGAGKSILIDAMGLLLGERASTEVVRKGAAKSIVEGIFDVKQNYKIKTLLEENNIDFLPELIVRREISLKGSNRCFINDTPVTLNLIKDIGYLLVDLHGQHEHQSLLRTDTHIEMLDEYGNFSESLKIFQKLNSELKDKINSLNRLKEKEQSLKEKKELYQFQVKEIDAIDPQSGEEEELLNELNILENSERLLELTLELYQQLYDSELSVHDNLTSSIEKIKELQAIDNSFTEKLEELKTALVQVNDVADFLRSYKDQIELEPAKLNEVRDRLGAFSILKKKYGGSVEKVIEHRKKIGEELDFAENFTERISELKKEIDKLRIEAGAAAENLSKQRKKTAEEIKDGVEKALSYLGIQDAVFETKFTVKEIEGEDESYLVLRNRKIKFNRRGFDEVEFYISTNIGEDVKPLSKVASGGEISRIMLALKTILAKSEKLPLLIFDEIDTGVSGRIAQKVGQSLKELASFHQIIAITHLPQIAGLADYHFSVEKTKKENRVVSSIKRLSGEERINEVAKLMGGEEVTNANIKAAKELMKRN